MEEITEPESESESESEVPPWAKLLHCVRTACALRGHCVHTAHVEAGILTQEYVSPNWLHSEAAKPK